MRAINGSTLTLASGTYHNTAGQIEADDTSTVELNGAYIEGGTVSTSGSGHIDVTSSATPDGAGLVNSGTVNVLNNTTLNLTGHITNQGDINLQSSGSTTNLLLTGDVTLDGGGTVNLSDNPLNRLYSSGGPYTLTNEDNVIRGSGDLGLNAAGLVNRGTVQADQATALVIDPQDTAGFSNEGLLKVSGSGGLTINPGTFANAGTVSVDMGRQLTRQGIYNADGGDLADRRYPQCQRRHAA